MSSPPPQCLETQMVAVKVMKRAKLTEMARSLQSRLNLAHIKAENGWVGLSLDALEPKLEERRRQQKRRVEEQKQMRMALESWSSPSSSTTISDLPAYPRSRGLMSSPMKASAPLFSDAISAPSSSAAHSTGHRKRTFNALDTRDAVHAIPSSPSKRLRPNAAAVAPLHRSTSTNSFNSAKRRLVPPLPSTASLGMSLRLAESRHVLQAPMTSYSESMLMQSHVSFDEGGLLPEHSFYSMSHIARSSPPRTPSPQLPCLSKQDIKPGQGTAAESLMLYCNDLAGTGVNRGAREQLKAIVPSSQNSIQAPSTPPSRVGRHRPDVEKTPGISGSILSPSGLFPVTPGPPVFDISDFVNLTPSPAPKTWKTPAGMGKTPRSGLMSGTRLTFGDMP